MSEANNEVPVPDPWQLPNGMRIPEATRRMSDADKVLLHKQAYDQAGNFEVLNKRDVASDEEIAAFQSQPDTVLIAASRGDGLDELQAALLQHVRGAGLDRTGSSTIVTNLRHARSLEKTNEALDSVLLGLSHGTGTELVAADLRQALAALGEITGEISSDDLLTSIFTQFCIGK